MDGIVANNRNLPTLKELSQMATTFGIVTFAWIFFRADKMSAAFGYIKQIVFSILNNPQQFLHLPGSKIAFLYIIPLVIGV